VLQVATKRGAVGIITARRKAMLMNAATFAASGQMGFYECPPQFGFDENGLRVSVPPENIPSLIHLIKAPLVIGALGEGIAVLDGNGYRVDREYYYTLAMGAEGCKDLHSQPVYEDWRNGVIRVFRKADRNGDILRALSALEFRHNYLRGLLDVPGPDHRIEIKWDEEHFGDRAFFTKLQVLARLRGRYAELLRPYRVKFIDESKPGKRSQIYAVPEEGCKRGMINRIVDKVCEHSGLTQEQLIVNFFGDMPPDLEAGLKGKAVKTFGLAGGSLLAKPLLRGDKFYSGESLRWIYDAIRPTDTPGVYDVVDPANSQISRRFYILDALFPGLLGPKSIEAFYLSPWAETLPMAERRVG
jgi:hypothetical protein